VKSTNGALRHRAERVRKSLREHQDHLSLSYLEDYVRDLLPLELECARSLSDDRVPSVAQQGGTLVLLVGYSLEPLLQSVAAYKPGKVVLVLNQF
jgi:hypothetical protein